MTLKIRNPKFRSPLKTHGGKSYLAASIIPILPYRDKFIDACGGGANIVGNIEPLSALYYNDLNPALVEFFRNLKAGIVDCNMPYSEESFETFKDSNILVRTRMSRGGLGKTFASSTRLRGGKPGDINAWETMIASLDATIMIFKSIIITRKDVLDILKDAKNDTLVYIDPPYLQSTRVSKHAYGNFELFDHKTLLSAAIASDANVAISGYPSDLYTAMLHDWATFSFDVANHSGQSTKKQRRTEMLWLKEET